MSKARLLAHAFRSGAPRLLPGCTQARSKEASQAARSLGATRSRIFLGIAHPHAGRGSGKVWRWRSQLRRPAHHITEACGLAGRSSSCHPGLGLSRYPAGGRGRTQAWTCLAEACRQNRLMPCVRCSAYLERSSHI